MQINDRLDLNIRAASRIGYADADRTILTVFTKQIIVTVIPPDIEPHATAFRVTGNQLMAGQVDHFQGIATNLQVTRLLQVFYCALLA